MSWKSALWAKMTSFTKIMFMKCPFSIILSTSHLSDSFGFIIAAFRQLFGCKTCQVWLGLTLKSLKPLLSLIVHCILALSRSLDINGSLPSVYLESNTEMSRVRHHNNRKCMNKTIIINMYLDIPSLHKQPSPSHQAEMILW